VRAVVRPPSSFGAEEKLLARMKAGSYEAPLLFAMVLAAMAIVGRVPGVWKSVGLAIEMELVYLAGVRFGLRFLRRSGGRAFVFSLLGIAWNNFWPHQTMVLGHATWNWTPPVLFHAFLFYVNRGLFRGSAAFSYSAAALVMAVLGAECPERYVGMAWLLFATILFEIGERRRAIEFRAQAYFIGACGVIATAAAVSGEWIPVVASLALVYANVLRNRFAPQFDTRSGERSILSYATSVSTAILAMLLLWRTVPESYVALSWCALGVVLFELALWNLPAEMRVASWVVALIGGSAVVVMHANGFVKFPVHAVSISWFGAALCAWLFTVRALRKNGPVRDVAAALGTALAMPAIWLVVPDAGVGVLWAALAVVWIELGFACSLRSFRWLGNAVLAPVFIWELGVNLSNPHLRLVMMTAAVAVFCYAWLRQDTANFVARLHVWAGSTLVVCLLSAELARQAVPAGWMIFAVALVFLGTHFRLADLRFQSYATALLAFALAAIQIFALEKHIALDAVTIAGLYLAQFLSEVHERRARAMFSLLGTALLTMLLYHEVSGGLLTVACGVEGLVLLGAGFALRERVLRWQGLVLLLACILKLFLYDLRNLETMYRILSFIALGLILLAVSWVYTRFREQLRRIL
jgi:hypothetical protein